ncbi:MAG TPA: hypothetical protein VK668_03725 [Mucilaginibacter sp.]|nr:hypothetical protein [Mucilaginibacter sp.]
MANWCFNTVRFTGEPAKVKQVIFQFLNLRLKEMETGHGQLPDFIKGETNYFFELSVKGGTVTFVTRWIPPVEIMVEIAKHYAVDFEFDFEEIANGIYGKAIYRNGKATVFNLSAADFAAYDFDEDAGKYRFEGQYYDDNAEIFELMLKRKMENVEL